MANLENITNKILEDARLEADNILKDANEKALTIKNDLMTKAEKKARRDSFKV